MVLSLSLSRVLVTAVTSNPIICTRHRTKRASFHKQGQDTHTHAQACYKPLHAQHPRSHCHVTLQNMSARVIFDRLRLSKVVEDGPHGRTRTSSRVSSDNAMWHGDTVLRIPTITPHPTSVTTPEPSAIISSQSARHELKPSDPWLESGGPGSPWRRKRAVVRTSMCVVNYH